jgi:hypothetical protein
MPKGQRTKASDWVPHIEAWKASRLSKQAYCLAHQINYKIFTGWCRRIRLLKGKPVTQVFSSKAPTLFMPVAIKSTEEHPATATQAPFVLMLSKQWQLHIPVESMNVLLLQTLFKSLGVLSC